MIVILEGPRGVGKTTIANEMKRQAEELRLHAVVEKFERGSDPIVDMYDQLELMQKTPSILHIVDRFHLTEFVMSTALARYDDMKSFTDKIWGLDRNLYLFKTPVVVLTAPTAFLLQRVGARADGRGFELPESVSETLWRAAGNKSKGDVIDVSQRGAYHTARAILISKVGIS